MISQKKKYSNIKYKRIQNSYHICSRVGDFEIYSVDSELFSGISPNPSETFSSISFLFVSINF